MDFANIPIKLWMTIFVIIFFLGSIAFFSYLGVSFDTDGTSVLKRSAVFEGFTIKTKDETVVKRTPVVRRGRTDSNQDETFQIKARAKVTPLKKRYVKSA